MKLVIDWAFTSNCQFRFENGLIFNIIPTYNFRTNHTLLEFIYKFCQNEELDVMVEIVDFAGADWIQATEWLRNNIKYKSFKLVSPNSWRALCKIELGLPNKHSNELFSYSYHKEALWSWYSVRPYYEDKNETMGYDVNEKWFTKNFKVEKLLPIIFCMKKSLISHQNEYIEDDFDTLCMLYLFDKIQPYDTSARVRQKRISEHRALSVEARAIKKSAKALSFIDEAKKYFAFTITDDSIEIKPFDYSLVINKKKNICRLSVNAQKIFDKLCSKLGLGKENE